MTSANFLAYLLRRGAAVVVVRDRLRVEAPPGVLTPSVREALATNKGALLSLMPFVDQYRAVLCSAIDESQFRDAQARLIDELGPVLAAAVQRAMDREENGKTYHTINGDQP